MAQLIDGKKISKQIKDELKEEVQRLGESGKNACLAVVRSGTTRLRRSMLTIKRKPAPISASDQSPMNFREATTEEELVALVEDLNADETVNGILVQLPLPAHIDAGPHYPHDLTGQRCRRVPSGQRGPALDRRKRLPFPARRQASSSF